MSEVFTVALDLAKVAERVRSPPLTPCPSSPTGRGAAFRARRFRVRIPGGAPRSIGPAATAAPCYGVHRATGAKVRVLHAPLEDGWLIW